MNQLLTIEQITDKTAEMNDAAAADFLLSYIKEAQRPEPTPEFKWSNYMAKSYGLTPGERVVLEALYSRMGLLTSTDEIVAAYEARSAHKVSDKIEAHIIKVFVSKLRKKLAGSAYEIKTLPGHGYCLAST